MQPQTQTDRDMKIHKNNETNRNIDIHTGRHVGRKTEHTGKQT